MSNGLTVRCAEIQARSRLNQNVIIDQRGLRIGRKVWIERTLLPPAIQDSSFPLCLALRGPLDLANLIQQISQDRKLLSGEAKQATHLGVSVTSDFSRVLLVAPDFQRVRKFVSPSLGLERIAAYLRHHNPAVDVETYDPNLTGKVTDEQATGPDDPGLGRNHLVQYALDHPFDVIGFSVLTPTLKYDAQSLMQISGAFEDSTRPLLVMGNYGVLLGADEIFSALKPVDALVWGPGEYPMAAIAKALQRLKKSTSPGETLRSAALFNALSEGLSPAIMQTRNSRIAHAAKDQRMLFLSEGQLAGMQIPLDHYAIPYEEHWATYRDKGVGLRFHLSNASCPFICGFCSTLKGKLSFTPLDTVEDMFRHARQAYPEVTHFALTDDNLFSNRSYLSALAEIIHSTLEQDEELTFYGQARADSLKLGDGNLLQTLRKMGLRHVAVGVESFSDVSLGELKKRTTGQRAQQTIALLTENDILTIVNLILFIPNITLNNLFISIEKALEVSKNPKVSLDPNFALAAYSGAPFTEEIRSGSPSSQPWIRETSIVYENLLGLQIPDHFSIISPLMDQLQREAKQLSKQAVETTETDPNELGRRGLMVLWAVLAIIISNSSRFNDANAGEGASSCAASFNQLAEEFKAVIQIRYPMEAERILTQLARLEIPSL